MSRGQAILGPDAPDSKWFSTAKSFSFFALLLLAASLVTSRAMLSISAGAFVAGAVFSMPPGRQLKRWFRGGTLFWFSLAFFPYLISWFWVTNTKEWGAKTAITLPVFAVLYGAAVLGPFTQRQIRACLWALTLSVVGVGAATVIHYLLHFEEVNEAILRSKPIETATEADHIYFSFILAFTVFCAAWLSIQKVPLFWKRERVAAAILSILGFVFLHIITTRTGLVAFYACALATAVYLLLRNRKFLLALLFVLGLCSVPVAGYYFIPSLHNRIDNTIFDVTRYFKGKDPNYLSIGTRLESFKTAVHLWQTHPWFGVGMGDIEAEMYYQYTIDKSELCPENQIEPHNQFLQLLAGLGLFGFVPFTFGWLSVFIRKWRTPHELFWPLYLMLTLSMMGESITERQIGVLFLVFGMALLYRTRIQEQDTQPYRVPQ